MVEVDIIHVRYYNVAAVVRSTDGVITTILNVAVATSGVVETSLPKYYFPGKLYHLFVLILLTRSLDRHRKGNGAVIYFDNKLRFKRFKNN